MFKKLDRFDVSRATSWVDMPELGADARICVKPATDANLPYFNAMMERAGKRARVIIRTDKITAEDAAANRDDDRVLYPRFVIVNWEGIDGDPSTAQPGELDGAGHVVHSRRAAEQLCKLLPAHLMDRVRNHAATPERFYGEAPARADDIAGNSEPGSASS